MCGDRALLLSKPKTEKKGKDIMTDTTKYKNVSLDLETYNLLKQQSKQICDVDLSIAQTVRHNTTICQQMLESPNYGKPLRGTTKYQEWKQKLLAKYLPVVMRKENKHANSN